MPFPSGRVTGSRVHLNMGLTDVGLSTTGSACGRMRWPLASCGLPGQCRSDFRFEANAAAPDGRSWGDLDPAAGRFVRRTPNRTQPVVGRSDLGPTSVPPRALDAHCWPLRRGRDRQQARTAANGKALDQRASVKCRLERFCAVSLDGEFDYRRVASPEEVSMCARQGCGHSALVELCPERVLVLAVNLHRHRQPRHLTFLACRRRTCISRSTAFHARREHAGRIPSCRGASAR